MSFKWDELGKTFRDSTFATWFGWALILAIVVFPGTSLIGSCWNDSVREDIELAKLDSTKKDRDESNRNLMKWMVGRGVHPLVARCSVYNYPSLQCGSLIGDLEEEERSTIKELLQNPTLDPVNAEVITIHAPADPDLYVKDLDFAGPAFK